MKQKPKYGYMCSTEWDYEAGETRVDVYPTVKRLRKLGCVKARECGVYKIEMRLVKVLRKGTL